MTRIATGLVAKPDRRDASREWRARGSRDLHGQHVRLRRFRLVRQGHRRGRGRNDLQRPGLRGLLEIVMIRIPVRRRRAASAPGARSTMRSSSSSSAPKIPWSPSWPSIPIPTMGWRARASRSCSMTTRRHEVGGGALLDGTFQPGRVAVGPSSARTRTAPGRCGWRTAPGAIRSSSMASPSASTSRASARAWRRRRPACPLRPRSCCSAWASRRWVGSAAASNRADDSHSSNGGLRAGHSAHPAPLRPQLPAC